MKFSMIFEAQTADTSPEAERQLLHDCVEQSVFAEEMGFDRIWAVEHHSLKWYAHMSAPEIFLSWVAAKTSRIRIGHGVVCMPFGYNHPLRVAERAATLDALSGGRLDVGAGRGATLQEMSAFGVQPEDTYDQVEESLQILSRVWLEEEFEWHGSLEIAPHPIIPRPVQMPHPPLYLACTKRDTVQLAAELGVGALTLGFAGLDEIRILRELYDEAREAADGSRFVSSQPTVHFSALCPTIVLDDRDKAFSIGARGQRFFAEAIMHWNLGMPPPSAGSDGDDAIAAMAESKERYVAKISEMEIPLTPNSASTYNLEHAYGNTDDAIRYITELQNLGADEIMCIMQMGTVPHEAIMSTIQAYGETIIPHFRAQEAEQEAEPAAQPAAAVKEEVAA